MLVQPRRGAPPFRVCAVKSDSLRARGSSLEMMNGPADGPGTVELRLVERFGCGRHVSWAPALCFPQNMAAPIGPGLVEGDDRLVIVDPRVLTDPTRSLPLVAAIANALSLPLVALIWEAMSSHVIGCTVGPHGFGIDRVRDDLRTGGWSARRW